MFLNKLSEIPKTVWIVTAVTVNVQPTYTTLNTLAMECPTEDDALRILHDWKKRNCVVYQEISKVDLDVDQDRIREDAIRALTGRKHEIMAERQQELDEVDEAIQNLLALPAPNSDNEGDWYVG